VYPQQPFIYLQSQSRRDRPWTVTVRRGEASSGRARALQAVGFTSSGPTLPTVLNDPRSDSVLITLVRRLRCKKGTLFRFLGQLRIVATHSMTIRGSRSEYSLPERLPPFPADHLSGTVCSPNRTGSEDQQPPVSTSVPYAADRTFIPWNFANGGEVFSPGAGAGPSVSGYKSQGARSKHLPGSTTLFNPSLRTFSPNLPVAFSIKLHNEDLRNPLRSPGPGSFLQRWCVPILPLPRSRDSLLHVYFRLAALKRQPHTDELDPATVPYPGI